MNGHPPESSVKTSEMHPNELSKSKILLIDELDFLMTKDQSVLFNLFEWPQRRKANLIVLSVANTLDLPEMFMARISSRIGNTRLVFSPYTSNEIRDIITERVAETGIFDSSAINFIAKKVALISSDIRKTLNICRQAVEKHRSRNSKGESHVYDEMEKISMSLVSEIFEKNYGSSPLNEFVKKSNQHIRAFLTEMYLEMNMNNSKVALFTKVYERYKNATLVSSEQIRPSEFLILIRLFVEKNIITTKENYQSNCPELHLQTNLDELAYALKDDPYFQKKYVP